MLLEKNMKMKKEELGNLQLTMTHINPNGITDLKIPKIHGYP
jgi:hypothetical protein